jgi:phage tail-like protein
MTETSTASATNINALAGLEGNSAGGALMVQPEGAATRAPAAVSHVADHYRRYPGETLNFFTQVQVGNRVPGFTIQVSLPENSILGEYSASDNHEKALARVLSTPDGRYVVWQLDRAVEAGESFEYTVEVKIPPTIEDVTLESTALVLGEGWNATESVEVFVKAKSSYLKYLPAIYYEDELMGRFLMIFESMWNPLEKQVDNISYYFDPKMTPTEFVPWLASWSDLSLDERWTELQQRRLLASAARLYRMRGTKRGLVEYLEIYTGRKAVVTEHRANNLRLGKDSKFGPSVALGQGNRPHSFTVYLTLPPIVFDEHDDETTRKRKENDRKRTIEPIIESEKPAHTTYTLVLETEE